MTMLFHWRIATFLLSTALSCKFAVAASELILGKPHTTVVDLDASTLNKAIEDPANPIWVLKFYAPWCGHCKKLAPVLDTAASRTVGKLAFGKIDCTVEKALCDHHDVRGYPTLKYAMDGGEVRDYPGRRSVNDFVQFADKLNRPAVVPAESLAEAIMFAQMKSDNGVIFLAFDPTAPESGKVDEQLQSSLLTKIFAQVARKKRADTDFMLLRSTAVADAREVLGVTDEETAPNSFICRIESGFAPRCYEGELNTIDVAVFVRDQGVATVSQLGANNFFSIGRSGRPLLIGVVASDEEIQVVTARLRKFALEGPEELRVKYNLGWMDARQWKRYLEQFGVTEKTPQFFSIDVPSKNYWQSNDYGMDIEKFLTDIANGVIEPQNSGAVGFKKILQRLLSVLVENRPWSIVIVVFVVIGFGAVIASIFSPGEDFEDQPAPPTPPSDPSASVPSETTTEETTTTETEATKASSSEAEEAKKEK